MPHADRSTQRRHIPNKPDINNDFVPSQRSTCLGGKVVTHTHTHTHTTHDFFSISIHNFIKFLFIIPLYPPPPPIQIENISRNSQNIIYFLPVDWHCFIAVQEFYKTFWNKICTKTFFFHLPTNMYWSNRHIYIEFTEGSKTREKN